MFSLYALQRRSLDTGPDRLGAVRLYEYSVINHGPLMFYDRHDGLLSLKMVYYGIVKKERKTYIKEGIHS